MPKIKHSGLSGFTYELATGDLKEPRSVVPKIVKTIARARTSEKNPI